MARRHKHMIGYRILFVIAIPTLYFLCVSAMELFSSSSADIGYTVDWPVERYLANFEWKWRNDYYQPVQLVPIYFFFTFPILSRTPGGRKLLQINETKWQDNETSSNCTPPAIKEFPSDGLTRQQRQRGFIIIHFLVAVYLFLLLAIVCDDYFVPSIKRICERIKVTEDVAGATVMAAASSSPELFINVIGTFVTEGDLGVGTIVGSAVFNILAVPACCALFANQILKLDWWPISRDTLAYAFTVLLLILTLQNGRVEWYEALILVACYILYISADIVSITTWPSSINERIWWVITWPITLALFITIPDCRRSKLRSWYFLTFIMCVIWIATSSYVIGWVITIIGDTFLIPDSIMGLTFLAAGMSVPEAVSSVIVTNQGHGAMGISNSIGSNVFDVLLCLGLPWFIKAALLPKKPGEYYVQINSQGLVYSSISLFSTLMILYGSLLINKFKLNRTVGIVCLVMYIVFLIFASIVELNTFFAVNLPTCVQ